MDQPVRKHKTYRHPAGCYCCQFQDNKWFSLEQNSKLLFHRAIKAVDIAYWHTARVNITYCISFHSELSSGRSTITDIIELYTALKEFSWMIEKHVNYIFKHITHCILRSYSTAVCNGLVLFSWRQQRYLGMKSSGKKMVSVAFLVPQHRCPQHIKNNGKCLSSAHLQCGPWQQPSQGQSFWAYLYYLVVVCFTDTPITIERRMRWSYTVKDHWWVRLGSFSKWKAGVNTCYNQPARNQIYVLEIGAFEYISLKNKPTVF